MKRLTAMLLSLLMVLALCVTAMATEPINYLALGDSFTSMDLTANLGRKPDEIVPPYPQYIAAQTGWNVDNKGATGWRTDEMLFILGDEKQEDSFMRDYLPIFSGNANHKRGYNVEILKDLRTTYTDAIKNADLISIALGSNDLLGNIRYYVEYKKVFGDLESLFSSDTADTSSRKNITTLLTGSVKLTNLLLEATLNFRENWDEIIDGIRELNPDAEIIVLSSYSPLDQYAPMLAENGVALPDGVLSALLALIDSPITSINDYMRVRANADDYIYVDITDVPIDDDGSSPDTFHPGFVGQQYIADKVLEAYDTYCTQKNTVMSFNFQTPILHIGYSGEIYRGVCGLPMARGKIETLMGSYSFPASIDRIAFKAAVTAISMPLKGIIFLSDLAK